MITINIDLFFWNEEIVDEVLTDLDDDILLFDLAEGSRFDGAFPKVHDKLEDKNVWFLCSDLNIKDRYVNWCKDNGKPEVYKTLSLPFPAKIDVVDFVKDNV